MSTRTSSGQTVSAGSRPGRPPGPDGWTGLPARLRAALAVAVVGGVATGVGPLLPVVKPTTMPGFTSGPLLLVVGLLPVVVALVLTAYGRAASVAGALLAAALFAPGQAITEAQLAVDGSLATRPELVMPTSLAALHGAVGLWLVMAGRVLTVLAGILALSQANAAEREARAGTARPGTYQGPMVAALLIGAVAAVGLAMAPFRSTDPFMLAPGVLDAPPVALFGGLLIAVAAPLAATVALATTDPSRARGALLGCAVVMVAIALPRIVSGLLVSGLHPAPGPYVVLVAAAALIGLALRADRAVRTGYARTGYPEFAAELDFPQPAAPGWVGNGAPAGVAPDGPEPAEWRLPGPARLRTAAGWLGVASAVAALVAAATPLFANLPPLPAGFPQPDASAGRALVPAAVLVGLLGAAMLVRRWAPLVRPAFAVAWVAMPLTGMPALDTALGAVSIDGVTLGIGMWAVIVAVPASIAAACCAAMAGGIEREDVDLTELPTQVNLLGPAVAAVLLSVGAFGMPLSKVADATVPGLWSNFRIGSWGLVFGVLAVIIAALIAPKCRPGRAVALLLGAAGVVLVRLLELPLTRLPEGAIPGAGTWLAVACAVALLAGAGIAGWASRTSRHS